MWQSHPLPSPQPSEQGLPTPHLWTFGFGFQCLQCWIYHLPQRCKPALIVGVQSWWQLERPARKLVKIEYQYKNKQHCLVNPKPLPADSHLYHATPPTFNGITKNDIPSAHDVYDPDLSQDGDLSPDHASGFQNDSDPLHHMGHLIPTRTTSNLDHILMNSNRMNKIDALSGKLSTIILMMTFTVWLICFRKNRSSLPNLMKNLHLSKDLMMLICCMSLWIQSCLGSPIIVFQLQFIRKSFPNQFHQIRWTLKLHHAISCWCKVEFSHHLQLLPSNLSPLPLLLHCPLL